MRQRRFGDTDLLVSELGFGGSRIGGLMSSGTTSGGVATLHAAHDAGITFYDTADMYSQGEGEELIGRAFHDRRHRVVIATKGGYLLPTRRKLLSRVKPLVRPIVQFLGIRRSHLPGGASGALTQDFSPTYITSAVEASLRRLRTDYIDVYQLHSPPPAIYGTDALIEALRAVEALQRAGKVRHVGVAADSLDDAEACAVRATLQSLQVPFGLLDPDVRGVLPTWHAQGTGVIVRGCFGGGFLKESLAEAALRAQTPKCDWILGLRALAAAHGRSTLELALQFVLRTPGIAVTLLGMRTVEHVRDNVRCYDAPPITDEELAACHALAAAHLPRRAA